MDDETGRHVAKLRTKGRDYRAIAAKVSTEEGRKRFIERAEEWERQANFIEREVFAAMGLEWTPPQLEERGEGQA